MIDTQELRMATMDGFKLVEERPPNSVTWTPAVYCFDENPQPGTPAPTILQINPDGSIWADWDAVRRYVERFPVPKCGERNHQGMDGAMYIALALHDGQIADKPWAEVLPLPLVSPNDPPLPSAP